MSALVPPAARQDEVGRARLRIEDEALLLGRGRFVDDHAPAGCLHLAFARSPVAHAAIRSLDVEMARAMPGVASVITAADLGGIGPLRVNRAILDLRAPQRPLLAKDDVRYVGEPMAAVVATSLDAARDAAERIEVDFEPGEAQIDTSSACAEVFREAWRSGDVEAAFAAAEQIVRLRIEQPRVAACPLEARAAMAQWDPLAGQLIVWTSSQTPHRVRADLAELLGLDAKCVRAIAGDVGGAFGSKASIYPEDVVVAWAARQLGRPVKWIAVRGEDLLSASHGRGGILEGELALTRAGALIGLRATVTFPLGAWLPYSAAVPAWNAARILPGPYAIRDLEIAARGVLTDTAPLGIYRGAGRPEAAMLMERLVEKAARAIGMDPADLRRRNLLAPKAFPYRTATGQTLDSGDYPRLLGLALRTAGYPALCRERDARRARGELYGIGLAFYVEPCGQGWESATVRLDADGRAVVASGTSPQGQGQATAFAQIAADALDIAFEDVRVVQGDSLSAPVGTGALASRSTAIGGSAVLQAAREAHRRAGSGERPPIEVAVRYAAAGEAWSAGCCIAAVSIDAETGVLRIERFAWADDAGRIVNPPLVEGQLTGGFAQGIGQALMERIVHDPDGQLLSGSLMDYALPRASDVPALSLAKLETQATVNLLGAKGVGEAGAIGAPAALLNAAADALSARGLQAPGLPLTSEALWRILRKDDDDEIR